LEKVSQISDVLAPLVTQNVATRVLSHFHDEAARFVHLLTVANPSGAMADNKRQTDSNFNAVNGVSSRTYLVPEDFVPLVQDVVDTHPGLTFLKEASEFHSRYVHTVSDLPSAIIQLLD
jgi:hypothetical protein